MYKIAVITFPGMNREVEAKRAINRVGMEGTIFRWNDNPEKLADFDGYMFPGGFSYEDRGRSGVVAAQDPVIEYVKKEAQKGKPVIGVCNGAQVLVETGMIPGVEGNHLQCGLGWNERIKDGEVLGTGFYNTWVNLKNTAKKGRSAFNNFDKLLYVPIAHGEGRFVFEESLYKKLVQNDQIVLSYSDEDGNIVDEFPVNPNGSIANIAGICNEHGNIMAMMPHPETFKNGDAIFESIKKYLEKGINAYDLVEDEAEGAKVEKKENYDIEFYVDLIITDNTEKTIERAVQKKVDSNVNLKRSVFWGIKSDEGDLKSLAVNLINSGELLNLNKENVKVKIGGDFYAYDKENGLVETPDSDFSTENTYYAFEQKDFIGMAKVSEIHHFLPDQKVDDIERAVMWEIDGVDEAGVQKVLDSFILHNPFSQKLQRTGPYSMELRK